MVNSYSVLYCHCHVDFVIQVYSSSFNMLKNINVVDKFPLHVQ